MQLESKTFLHDIRESARAISDFVSGQDRDAYAANRMLRRAVEREFEIIGEAMSQLAKRDAHIAAAIGEHRQIIGFRNVLIHGYRLVDDNTVWDVIQTKLPLLAAQVDVVLGWKRDLPAMRRDDANEQEACSYR